MGGTVGCPEYRGDVHLAQAAIFGEKNMIRILASMSPHFYRGGCRGASSEIRCYIQLRSRTPLAGPLRFLSGV